jgi:tRNA modification GTPase
VTIGGVPFILVDTAGLRDSEDVVESIGIDRARDETRGADLLLWMGEEADAPAHERSVQIAAKADLQESEGRCGLRVSALTGEGVADVAAILVSQAESLLPRGDELALDRRQHDLLGEGHAALIRASALLEPVLVAEELRVARLAIDRIAGRAGVEELLDSLFGRFCLGK